MPPNETVANSVIVCFNLKELFTKNEKGLRSAIFVFTSEGLHHPEGGLPILRYPTGWVSTNLSGALVVVNAMLAESYLKNGYFVSDLQVIRGDVSLSDSPALDANQLELEIVASRPIDIVVIVELKG